MDQPRSQTSPGNAEITLTPDMRPGAADPSKAPPAQRPARRNAGTIGALLLGSAGLVLGLAALGGTAWLHTQTQREILRLSTEMAQLRVSLDLYARNAARAEAATPVEQPILPPIGAPGEEVATPPASEAPATASTDDCLPSGMRLLVASGDNYPICGQSIAVDVATVDNGYVMLTDGTTIPSGGTVPLLGSTCMIGVTSSGDEGLTGYAEIRVTC